ncbi:MAG TPA: flippase [Dongiaceae bacterium]|nr:flippase [Dongiaceae bacterium]
MTDSRSQTPGVSRRLFSNTILNFGGQGFILVMTFVTAPYTVHHLGPELFGIVALVQTVAGFAGFLNLGIGRALTKYISELYWKNDWEQINNFFRTAWTTCLIAGTAGLIAIAGPRQMIGDAFFRGGSEVSSVTGYALFVAAFGLFTSMVLEVISAVPGALQRFDLVNSVSVLGGIIRCVGPVVLLKMGYGVKSVLIVNLLSNIVSILVFAYLSHKLIPALKFSPKFNKQAFAKLIGFSIPLFVSALSAIIVARVDRFILAFYMPLAAVTFYTLPYSISEKLALGVGSIASVVYPFASELHSREAHDKLQELYIRASKLLVLVTLPFMTLLLAVPSSILKFWLGQEYASQGAVCLALLGIATFLGAMSAVSTVTALGAGRAWMPASFAIATSAVNLLANFLLIPRYGINGAALGALVPQAVVVPVFIWKTTRDLQFSLGRVLLEALGRPFLCAGAQFAFLYLLQPFVTNLFQLLALCAASLAIFGVMALFIAASREEREELFAQFSANRILARIGLSAESK